MRTCHPIPLTPFDENEFQSSNSIPRQVSILDEADITNLYSGGSSCGNNYFWGLKLLNLELHQNLD